MSGTCGASLKSKIYVRKYREFLRRLRLAREAAGLSQEDVARALGKTQPFVSKCELGERRVDFVELQEFMKIYRIDASYFQQEQEPSKAKLVPPRRKVRNS